MQDEIMPSASGKAFPKSISWRTFALMAVIYAIPTSTLTLNPDDKFNYGLASLGAVSYVFVEGADLIREAQRSYTLPRDEEGYRVNLEFVPYTTKALSGILLFGIAFGSVEVARKLPILLGLSSII
jgi:hypothetical protein